MRPAVEEEPPYETVRDAHQEFLVQPLRGTKKVAVEALFNPQKGTPRSVACQSENACLQLNKAPVWTLI